MSRHQSTHRQIMLDADEQDDRIIRPSEQLAVEEFIAKFVRVVRRIEGKDKAAS